MRNLFTKYNIDESYILPVTATLFAIFTVSLLVFFSNNNLTVGFLSDNKKNKRNGNTNQVLQDTIEQKNKEIDELKLIIQKEQQQKTQTLQKQSNQHQIIQEELNSNLALLEDEKERLSSQLKQLQLEKDNEIHNLNQKILKLQQIDNGRSNETFDDYDIIIDFPNVDSFIIKNSSWTIFVCDSLRESFKQKVKEVEMKNQIKQENQENQDKKEEKERVKLEYPLHELLEGSHKFKTACVVGNFNRGKTFVINLINESKLPSGRRTKTKGLSIIISQNNATLFIDTQGCGTPLPNNSTENNEDLKKVYNIKESDSTDQELNNLHLARKKATELFHQEVAITLSNVVMHVVNEMTWSDQQSIMALQRKILNQDDNNKDSKESKYSIKSRLLYVIHNYVNVCNEEDLMANVKTYVTTPFKGQFQTLPHPECSIFYYDDAKNRTTHFFLCNNNSEFGKKWNTAVASTIRSNIKSIQNENPEFDKLLLKTVENSMKVNIKNPSSLKIINYDESKAQVTKPIEKTKNNFVFNRIKNDLSPEFKTSLEEYEDLYDSISTNEVDITQIPLFSIVPNEEVQDPKHFALKDKDIEFIDSIVVFSGGFKPSFDRLEIGDKLIFTFDLPFINMEDIKHCIQYDKYEDKNYLRVYGTRVLQYKCIEDSITKGGDIQFITNDYPLEGFKQTPTGNPRKHGEFDIKIPIPGCYSHKYHLDFDNGMLSIVFENLFSNMFPDKSI